MVSDFDQDMVKAYRHARNAGFQMKGVKINCSYISHKQIYTAKTLPSCFRMHQLRTVSQCDYVLIDSVVAFE